MDFEYEISHLHQSPKNAARTASEAQKIYPLNIYVEWRHSLFWLLMEWEIHKVAYYYLWFKQC